MKHLELAGEYGIKPDEFWQMIPSEFVIYLESRIKSLIAEEDRHRNRTALLAATIANFSQSRKKNRKYKLSDFLPKKKQTTDDMLKSVEKLNRIMGGEDRRTTWQK